MALVKLHISSLASLCFIGASSESIGKTLRFHEHAGSAFDVHSADVFGSTMSRIFTEYEGLPVGANALNKAGWMKHDCDENLGYAWTKGKDSLGNNIGLTTKEPLKLYTNEDGLPSGVGTIIRKYLPPSQIKYTTKNSLVEVVLEKNDEEYWHVDVAFRTGNQCVNGMHSEGIGDKLTLNPGAASEDEDESIEIPLNKNDAVTNGWQKGSCFDGMGWHYFYNTHESPLPLPMDSGHWNKGDLLPVVAMYYEGKINAIFFASAVSQSTPLWWRPGLPRRNKWEPANLPDPLMCANFCGECGFVTTDLETSFDMTAFSTMHIYFNDHNAVKCADDSVGSLKCVVGTSLGCCESDVFVDRPLAFVNGEAAFQPFANQGWIWVSVGGGFGLFVSVVAAFIVKRRRQSSVRTVQSSELVA